MIGPLETEVEKISCCLGCSDNDQVLFEAGDGLHHLPGRFGITKCQACGLIRTNPRPTQAAMEHYYPDNYAPYLGTVVQPEDGASPNNFRKILRPLLRRIFDSRGTHLPVLKAGNLLEIGCASGSFLKEMADKGWNVQGIEFSKMAAKAARQLGYPVHQGPLENAPQPPSPLDLIVGWMVLEHLHDPISALKKLHNWSTPEAWFIFSVPNAGSLEFRIFKDNWYALQAPTHLHHFTPNSLKKVIEASGWHIVKIHHQRTLSNLVASIGYTIKNKGHLKLGEHLIDFPNTGGFMTYVLYPLSWLLSLFGQTGRMTVWARKSAGDFTKQSLKPRGTSKNP